MLFVRVQEICEDSWIRSSSVLGLRRRNLVPSGDVHLCVDDILFRPLDSALHRDRCE